MTLYQLPGTYRAEQLLAQRVALLKVAPACLPPILVDKALVWAQERAGFAFDPAQAQAIAMALSHKLSILTGGPGTGKTTILRALVAVLKAKKVSVTLAAPTGRAAQRMGEATGHFAQTIHRLLKYEATQNSFFYNEDHPLKTDFIIIDEASMLDTRIASALFRAIPDTAHVLLVGDIHQLPSVGPGQVLADLLHSGHFAVCTLAKVFRQQHISGIVTTAHHILEGKAHPPSIVQQLDQINPKFDLHFLALPSPEHCLEAVVSLCAQYLPQWYPRYTQLMDVQVLCPMHKGVAGVGAVNQALQKQLNPRAAGIAAGAYTFGVGDKVIQLRNNYDKNIFNGDLGVVAAVNAEAQTVAIRFDDTLVELDKADLSDLALAYAISIHKSQGSEFPIVIVPLLKQHFMMLQRNLLYTAITRGRKKVFIIGQPSAYAMAVRNQEHLARLTDLRPKLQACIDGA
jgi:exodeoxyribonuclease V alpha subunit